MNKTYIFHIDMDSFFVSCERKFFPNLKNKPIAIAKEYKRSIASSISHELKQMGFKAGDPIYLLKERVKDLIIVEPHYNLYTSTAHNIFNFLKDNFSSKIEIYSIDECFLELQLNELDDPIFIASNIQNKIFEKVGIPCSIGISYTKFLAKMSTNKAKPHGIVWTKKEDIETNFYNLDIDKVFGIGKSSVPKLNSVGIFKYKDLITYDNYEYLRKVFGKNFYSMLLQMKGENNTEKIISEFSPKGISNSVTFMQEDSDNETNLKNKLNEIVLNISKRLIHQNLEGNNISLQIRNIDKQWRTFQRKIDMYTNNEGIILKNVLSLFNDNWNGELIRGIGARVSNLRSIFDKKEIDLFSNVKMTKVEEIMNIVNNKFEKQVLKSANQVKLENQSKSKSIKFLKEDNW